MLCNFRDKACQAATTQELHDLHYQDMDPLQARQAGAQLNQAIS
jgi:hypothetical protein